MHRAVFHDLAGPPHSKTLGGTIMKGRCPACGALINRAAFDRWPPFVGRARMVCPKCRNDIHEILTPLAKFNRWYGLFVVLVVATGLYLLVLPSLKPFHRFVVLAFASPLLITTIVEVVRSISRHPVFVRTGDVQLGAQADGPEKRGPAP